MGWDAVFRTVDYLLRQKSIAIIGASGAAFGTLLALAVMLPQEMITAMLYFVIPVRMKLWTLAMVLVGSSAVLAVLDVVGWLSLRIAHFDHLGGALAGCTAQRVGSAWSDA